MKSFAVLLVSLLLCGPALAFRAVVPLTTSARTCKSSLSLSKPSSSPPPYFSPASTSLFSASSIDPEDAAEKSIGESNTTTEKGDFDVSMLAVQATLVLVGLLAVYWLGTTLLSAASWAAGAAGEAVVAQGWQVLAWLASAVGIVLGALWQGLVVLLPAVFHGLAALWEWASPTLAAASQSAGQAAAPYVDQVTTQLGETMSPYMNAVQTAVDASVVAPLSSAMETATTAVDSAFQQTTDTITSTVDATVKGATDSVTTAVDSTLQGAAKAVQDAVGGAGSGSDQF